MPFPALAGFEKSLVRFERAGCPVRQAVRRRECFAVRYGLRLVFYTEGSLDSIKNFAVIPCALSIIKNLLCRNLSDAPQAPAWLIDTYCKALAISGWQVLRKASPIRAGRVSAESLKISDERETARSEGRHAGTSERLFESLPAGKNKIWIIILPKFLIKTDLWPRPCRGMR